MNCFLAGRFRKTGVEAGEVRIVFHPIVQLAVNLGQRFEREYAASREEKFHHGGKVANIRPNVENCPKLLSPKPWLIERLHVLD